MAMKRDLTLGQLVDARARLAASIEEVVNREVKAFYEETHVLPEIDVSVGMSIGIPPHYFVTVATEV